jgi:hypothetical protein
MIGVRSYDEIQSLPLVIREPRSAESMVRGTVVEKLNSRLSIDCPCSCRPVTDVFKIKIPKKYRARQSYCSMYPTAKRKQNDIVRNEIRNKKTLNGRFSLIIERITLVGVRMILLNRRQVTTTSFLCVRVVCMYGRFLPSPSVDFHNALCTYACIYV